jgi:hypothetical protein
VKKPVERKEKIGWPRSPGFADWPTASLQNYAIGRSLERFSSNEKPVAGTPESKRLLGRCF